MKNAPFYLKISHNHESHLQGEDEFELPGLWISVNSSSSSSMADP